MCRGFKSLLRYHSLIRKLPLASAFFQKSKEKQRFAGDSRPHAPMVFHMQPDLVWGYFRGVSERSDTPNASHGDSGPKFQAK